MKNLVTIIRRRGETTTYRIEELDRVVEMIRGGEWAEAVHDFRQFYPLIALRRDEHGEVDADGVDLLQPIPRLALGSAMVKQGGRIVTRQTNDLLLLQINNLASYDEALLFREAAAGLPQTLLTFLGASGRSVKIVCRGPFAAFALARRVLSDQLQVNVDNIPMTASTTCYLSHDPDARYNPAAIAFVAPAMPLKPTVARGMDNEGQDFLFPGHNLKQTRVNLFENILAKAVGSGFDVLLRNIGDEGPEPFDPERVYSVVTTVAEGCLEAGIPQELGERLMTQNRDWGSDRLLVRNVFERVYASKMAKAFIDGRRQYKPEKYVSKTALLTLRTEYFLETHYEMRRNVMTGTVQWRYNDGGGYAFRDLTVQDRNMMTIRALEMGLKQWDRDIERYINSPLIEQYDPIDEYLSGLPHWDGRDRVAELFSRIPLRKNREERIELSADGGAERAEGGAPLPLEGLGEAFHRWLLSMVAHWQGRDRFSGNALVPLLIGEQGTGKSSFCRLLLPPQLQAYYSDRINFRNDHDLNIGLSSFALINLDEFDAITQSQQPLLKYLISARDMKFRVPYGRVIEEHRKYASFIATTNQPQPLTDDSGSRRFLCLPVAGMIDFTTPVDHDQLYAQLVEELRQGRRYYLTDEENRQLMVHNAAFRRVSGLEEMVRANYSKTETEAEGKWLSVSAIANELKTRYPNLPLNDRLLVRLGKILSSRDVNFQRRHTREGNEYLVKS